MQTLASTAAVAPRQHGGVSLDELRRLAIDPALVVDFSVTLNPYGPPPAVRAAILRAPIEAYPEPTARSARAALAAQLAVDPDQIVIGNGAADLLWTLACVLMRPSFTAMIVEPTFAEFRAAVQAHGGRIVEWRAQATDDFAIDLHAVAALARAGAADVVYLCTPNTPTGTTVRATEVTAFASALPEVTVVLDQAFLPVSDISVDIGVPLPQNVICVRSLTKELGIAGVRVGYLVAAPEVAARVEGSRAAWTTSAAAQAAVVAACEDQQCVTESVRRWLGDRVRLQTCLREIGFAPLPSAAPFVLVPVANAAAVRQQLLTCERIVVRDCASFGLPDFMRVSARPARDCDRLLAALQQEDVSCSRRV